MQVRPADLAEIDNFCDALWLEDGLAKATLDSYRSDLGRLAGWLAEHNHEPLLDVRETTLTGFIAHLSRQTRASSQARYLSTLRRFYRWQVGRGRLVSDPTLKLANPSLPSRLPKIMSEKQVEALLDAPDLDTPLGRRDRAMLETLYATGLRVSELVNLKQHEVGLADGVLRALGKGSKERLVPLGQVAIDWIARYLTDTRPDILNGQHSGRPVRHRPGWRDDPAGFLAADQTLRPDRRHRPGETVAARATPRLRHPPAQPRCGPARGTAAARPRRHLDHADLHPRCPGTPEEPARGASPARLTPPPAVAVSFRQACNYDEQVKPSFNA